MSLIKTIQSTGSDRFMGAMFSTVDNRCLKHDGCIVDLGCLWWDWSTFFIGKKRIIGVDPFENLIDGVELFKGAISDFDGVSKFTNGGIDANMFSGGQSEVQTLSWKTFCKKFTIDKISVLKMNVEGSEYSIIKSFDENDFSKIDQIAVSFHDWVNSDWKEDTDYCIDKIISNGYNMIDLEQWGWKLFLKK